MIKCPDRLEEEPNRTSLKKKKNTIIGILKFNIQI